MAVEKMPDATELFTDNENFRGFYFPMFLSLLQNTYVIVM